MEPIEEVYQDNAEATLPEDIEWDEDEDDDRILCEECDGAGGRIIELFNGDPDAVEFLPCEFCNGSGLMPEKKFEFDAENHVYTLNGKRLYGITNILSVIAKPALIQWAADEAVKSFGWFDKKKSENVSADMAKMADILQTLQEMPSVDFYKLLSDARLAHRKKKDKAASQGTDMHAVIEAIIKEAIEKSNGYIPSTMKGEGQLGKFLEWAETNKVRFIASEKQMYSESLWIAGTCDMVFQKDGKTYIGDIKTTSGIYDRTPFFQCAGYSLMLAESEKIETEGYCIVRLGKDGSFEDKWSFDIEGDRLGFLSALALFKQLENY